MTSGILGTAIHLDFHDPAHESFVVQPARHPAPEERTSELVRVAFEETLGKGGQIHRYLVKPTDPLENVVPNVSTRLETCSRAERKSSPVSDDSG